MTSKDYTNKLFERNVPGTARKLRKTCVGIAGCGGLGSNAAVALVRAGVGRLILADNDIVEASNLNRQHFFASDIGEVKVEAMARHLKAINPEVKLTVHRIELTPENVAEVFEEADVMVEAFDKAQNKHWLIETWSRLFPKRPIVCGNGLAGCGRTADLKVRKFGNIYFCGDGESDAAMGLCSSRVAIVANMEANIAIGILVGENEP